MQPSPEGQEQGTPLAASGMDLERQRDYGHKVEL
jgi:hypothetical protein